jgi:hypothetical protein
MLRTSGGIPQRPPGCCHVLSDNTTPQRIRDIRKKDSCHFDRSPLARIHSLGDFAAVEARIAEPVAASFSADSQSATADLFYELPNKALSYSPRPAENIYQILKNSPQLSRLDVFKRQALAQVTGLT